MSQLPAREPAEDPSEAGEELWGGRRWTAIAAVGFLTVVLALTLLVVLNSGDQRASSNVAAGRGSAPSVTAAGTATSLPAAGQAHAQPLTAAPAGVTWWLVDGVALPFSATDGPRSTTGGVASGFSHSSAGALLACVQTALRIGTVNPASQAGEVRAMVIGAGKPALLASRPATVPAVKPQQAAFRYLAYTPDRAVISLAWRVTDVASNSSRFVAVGELQMVWAGGDWRLVGDGSQPPPPTGLDAQLTGYVPFGGA